MDVKLTILHLILYNRSEKVGILPRVRTKCTILIKHVDLFRDEGGGGFQVGGLVFSLALGHGSATGFAIFPNSKNEKKNAGVLARFLGYLTDMQLIVAI